MRHRSCSDDSRKYLRFPRIRRWIMKKSFRIQIKKGGFITRPNKLG